MTFKPSAGMTYGRAEIAKYRAACHAAESRAAEIAAFYREGNAAIEDVHAADVAVVEAGRRVQAARVSFEERRAVYARKFLEELAPIDAALRRDLADVADRLEAAIAPAREADAFALLHGLPVTRLVEQTGRLAHLVRDFRSTAN